jgi:hypothetical protein
MAAATHRTRFQNPYGIGDICAAGIIPFTYKGYEVLPVVMSARI